MERKTTTNAIVVLWVVTLRTLLGDMLPLSSG